MRHLMTVEEVCENVTDGTHYTPKNVGIGIPFLTVKDVTDSELDFINCSFITTEDYIAAKEGNSAPKKGDVLFSKDGTVGKVHVVTTDKPFAVLSSLAILRPRQNTVDATYFGHVLRSPTVLEDALKRKTGSAIRRIILSDLKKVKIPVPSLEEQKRITDILDRAEALRAKRQESLAQLDELTEAIFINMFGGHAMKEWPVTTIASLAHPSKGSIRTGPFGSQLLHSEFVDEGIAVLGIDNAVANEFQWGARRFISETKYKELKRYTVRPGDVLITIMGTCGRCAVVPDDIPIAINTKHLCCITLNQEKCIPTYLHAYFLLHPIAHRYLAQTAKGAIMAGLNMEIIKKMPIPLPPLILQKEFSSHVEAINKLKTAHKDSLAKLNELFSAFQHRAFRGEL